MSQSTLSLAAGQTVEVSYSVKVTPTGSVDSDPAVAGNMTFELDSLPPSDVIDGISFRAYPDPVSGTGILGTHTCVPPLPVDVSVQTLSCDYRIALPDTSARIAVGRAVANSVPPPPDFRQVHVPFDFSNPTINEVDECVNVSDTLQGPLGTVCASGGAKTFTYTRTIGPYAAAGQYSVPNTASYVATDSGKTGSSSANVDVTVTQPTQSACEQIHALIVKTLGFLNYSHSSAASMATTTQSYAKLCSNKPLLCWGLGVYIQLVKHTQCLTLAQKNELIADAIRIKASLGC